MIKLNLLHCSKGAFEQFHLSVIDVSKLLDTCLGPVSEHLYSKGA